MNITPKNRRVAITREATKNDPEDDIILVPKSGHRKESEYSGLYQVDAVADDATITVKRGDFVLVEEQMVEKDKFLISGREVTVYQILENYIKGVVDL